MNLTRLTIQEVQYVSYRLAKEMMEWNEPIPAFESRYPHKLESCLATPFQQFNARPLYPGLIKKSAMLFYLMVKNHPFENGNKRIAMATLFYFLSKNNRWLKVSNPELYQFATSIAKSKTRSKDYVLKKIQNFLREHIIIAA